MLAVLTGPARAGAVRNEKGTRKPMPQNGKQITVQVPVGLLKQHAWLRESADWVARILHAMGAKADREPDGGTAQDAKIRIRLYALNGIGERLQILLRIAERGNERVQTAIVRQLVEFVALGAYSEALRPEAKNDKYVFVRHETGEVVKTYGDRFVALGLANLTDGKSPKRTRAQVAAIYEDTSAYIHPSANELACFVKTGDGRRVATARGIEVYADILHSFVSGLCLRLDGEYELGELTDEDKRGYQEETVRRMKERNRKVQ